MKLQQTITELWHISRTALATQDCSLHSRMIYIRNEIKERYADLVEGMNNKQIWLTIEAQVTGNY